MVSVLDDNSDNMWNEKIILRKCEILIKPAGEHFEDIVNEIGNKSGINRTFNIS